MTVKVETNTDYMEFLDNKRAIVKPSGFTPGELNPMLFPFQAAVVRWALQRGKSALFEDCGLGKTPQQLEWAHQVYLHTGQNVLILAPLAVTKQTRAEGAKFGIEVTVCDRQDDMRPGINITNYEKLHHFAPDGLAGIVLDESSILKSYNGSTRKALNEFAARIPYRLACTATPAPNDLVELSNHAEFLGIMTGKEIIALYFTQDGNTTHQWRLKGHAREAFWKWMAQWSVAIRRPSDLGFDDDGFVLPDLKMTEQVVKGAAVNGYLIPVEAKTLQERREARRDSLPDRVAATAALANGNDESWLIWCDLNAESEALADAIPDAIEVAGRHSDEHKIDAMTGFSEGRYRVLVTKPAIAGFGMNWQHCHNMVFVGLSDSYEQQYQAIRRCWRFGQQYPVNVHVVTADTEGAVVANIKRKEKSAAAMFDNIVKHMGVYADINQTERIEMEYESDVATGKDWTLYLGDSIQTIDQIEDESVGFTIFSPPFPGMYAYTNSVNDVGNSDHIRQMIDHFRYLVKADKLMRVMMPGRIVAIHLMQLTAMKNRDGYIGIKDYRGRVIAMMEDEGWIYHGELTIDKNPQIQAVRNKERGLLFKSLAQDSSVIRPALADYLLLFRKPGENPQPIRAGMSRNYNPTGGWVTEKEWIQWAHPIWPASQVCRENGIEYDIADMLPPVWYRRVSDPEKGSIEAVNPWGIQETDVLNVRQARETDDERHLCPLQLSVIARAIKLWSAPGDLVYSPFAGIGSEGYEAIRHGRRFIGGELKRSYWQSAIDNLHEAERRKGAMSLFEWAERNKDAGGDTQ